MPGQVAPYAAGRLGLWLSRVHPQQRLSHVTRAPAQHSGGDGSTERHRTDGHQ